MKKILFISLLPFLLTNCAQLVQISEKIPQTQSVGVSDSTIANGLKQALNQGIQKQVSSLTQKDGFLGDAMVKILLPQELQMVEKSLRSVGLGNLVDQGITSLNRAAEGAVKDATPIFVNAIQQMSFTDARNILMGKENAATQYLQLTTERDLYALFNPVVRNSFSRVGADELWKNIIGQYNHLPFVQKVNPDLTDYVTQQALQGVFKKIAVEEKEIRTNFSARSSVLLERVFSLQD